MLTRSGASVRRRRDAAIGTTGLLECWTEVLEDKESLTEDDRQSALRMNGFLCSVTADFKNYHFTLVESIEDDEKAQREQATLHEHELKVTELVDRLGELMAIPQKAKPMTELDLFHKRIDLVEIWYGMIKEPFDHHGEGMDIYRLRGQEGKIKVLKQELKEIKKDLISVVDADELEEKRAALKQLLYDLNIELNRLARTKEEKPPTISGATSITGNKLPRIEVPTFDGNILNWWIFWEQFDSAIHCKPQLTDSDKLTSLREALKNGPAKNVVECLTQTSESYNEAIRCLQKHYDRPRVLHLYIRRIC